MGEHMCERCHSAGRVLCEAHGVAIPAQGIGIIVARQAPQPAPDPRRRLLLQQHAALMVENKHRALAIWYRFLLSRSGQLMLASLGKRITALAQRADIAVGFGSRTAL